VLHGWQDPADDQGVPTPLLIAAFSLLAAVPAGPGPRAIGHPMRTMGTTAQVVIVGGDSLATLPAARAAQRGLQRVDSLMSNWTQTSEVARINREAATATVTVEAQTAVVLDEAFAVGRATAGAMDITVEPLVRAWGFLGGPKRVPTEAEARAAAALVGWRHLAYDADRGTIRFDQPGVRIDLGGIAKGHGVDCAAESLLAHGVVNALVDVSGNMRAMGAPPGATHWRIGIRDPRDRVRSLGRVALSGRAIATSANYEQFVAQDGRRYGHILDPRSGRPAEGLLAVTVIASTAMAADAWDTGLFVLGSAEARRIAADRTDLDVMIIEPGTAGRDVLWVERSLSEHFVLDAAASGLVEVRWF